MSRKKNTEIEKNANATAHYFSENKLMAQNSRKRKNGKNRFNLGVFILSCIGSLVAGLFADAFKQTHIAQWIIEIFHLALISVGL